MTQTHRNRGTTLVEVVVATTLFVSIVGLVTLSLAAVFEGYSFMQRRSSIDQDGQYILARMRYASSQQDMQVVTSQFGSLEIAGEGANLAHLAPTTQGAGGITLEEGFMSGEYLSPIFNINDDIGAGTFVASVARPTGTSISYQIAVGDPIDSSCTNTSFVYVGADGTSGTRFDTDYFPVPRNQDGVGFENPAGCMRYKIYMSTTNTEKPLVYGIMIKK